MRKTDFTETFIAVLIVLSVTFILIGNSTASLIDGLVAYYPFNGNANDESGNNNNCNVFGATLIKDKFGIPNSAYSFDGIDDYMNCGAGATFNLNQEITVSAWVKLGSFEDAVIASKWKTRSGWSGSWFLSASNGPNFPTPNFGVAANGWHPTILTSDVSIELDTYNHIVGVYSITDNLLRIYVNGMEGGTARGPGGLAISNSDVLIGAFRYTITSGRKEKYINGVLDDVRIYNRALSNSEILDLYSKCGFVDVPFGYWAEDAICKIYDEGITTGCSTNPLKYCPRRDVNRAQMAVFLERCINDGDYTPPLAKGIFADVPVDFWAADWIEQLYKDGVTTGCAQSPLKYCPDRAVNRAQMAVFLLKAKHGSNYTPPKAAGIFADVPVTY